MTKELIKTSEKLAWTCARIILPNFLLRNESLPKEVSEPNIPIGADFGQDYQHAFCTLFLEGIKFGVLFRGYEKEPVESKSPLDFECTKWFLDCARVEIKDDKNTVFAKGVYDLYPLGNSDQTRLSPSFTLKSLFEKFPLNAGYPLIETSFDIEKMDFPDQNLNYFDRFYKM